MSQSVIDESTLTGLYSDHDRLGSRGASGRRFVTSPARKACASNIYSPSLRGASGRLRPLGRENH